jgi:hypothetical protein
MASGAGGAYRLDAFGTSSTSDGVRQPKSTSDGVRQPKSVFGKMIRGMRVFAA